MTDEVVVRRARIPDLPRVSLLAGELVRMHHDTDPGRFFLPEQVEAGYASWLRRELRRKGAVVLVAEVGAEIVGYAYGTLEPRDWNALLDDHGAIHDVFVSTTKRKSGVGKALVAALMRELEALGALRTVLYTMVSNESAQRLFRSAGFRPTMIEMTRSR